MQRSKPTPPMDPLLDGFLDQLWIERNLAENTLEAYRRDLKQLSEWLAAHQLALLTVSAVELQSFLAEKAGGRLPSNQFGPPTERYAPALSIPLP